MQKTQLTELIEVIDPLFEKIPLSDRQHTINTLLNIIKSKAISLLPKEREDIENTHAAGFADGLDQGINNTASPQSYDHNFFKQTFTQYKP